MNLNKIVMIVVAFSVLSFGNTIKAVEVVYSSQDLAACKTVGEYKKNINNRATRKKVEKTLKRMAKKDGASHVYITKFDDKRDEGNGITATAIGKSCD